MPEKPVARAIVYIILHGKGFKSTKHYVKLRFVVQIIPLCFSRGSAKRSYESLTVHRGDYVDITPITVETTTTTIETAATVETTTGMETPANQNPNFWLPKDWPPHDWRQWAEEPWTYLLDRPREAGPIICVSRGKLLVIAAGNHAVCISLGLEAHVFGMSPKDFYEIVSHHVPGPNNDPEKANRIRTFIIPDRLIVPGSSNSSRTIKIFAAFISAEWVYVVSDFSGLVRMHVRSKNSPWTEKDLKPDSEYWMQLFGAFRGGPDWILEYPLAISAIQRWRQAILEEHHRWKMRCEEIQKAYEKELRELRVRPIDSYFPSKKSGKTTSKSSPPPPPKPNFPSKPIRPIIREIGTNSLGAFSGFGRHTANDFLFQQAIFPGMPSHLLCEDDAIFAAFTIAVHAYLTTFTTEKFFNNVASVVNSKNPFCFNETSNDKYMKHYILVFRRIYAKLDRDLYVRYCKAGLFDPEHTMGEPYSESKAAAQIKCDLDLEKLSLKWRQVYLYDKPLNAYSIIVATCPPSWGGPYGKIKVRKDIAQFGYNTTIGLAQFHEQVLNRAEPTVKRDGGRPPKEHTGRRGRPSKAKTTKKAVEVAMSKKHGRILSNHKGKGREWNVEDVPMEVDIVSFDNIIPLDEMTTDVDPTTDIDPTTDVDPTIDNIVVDNDNVYPCVVIEEDPDDNAGDADVRGDGSACVEDQFIEYDGDENNNEDPAPATYSENEVLSMVAEDLDGVLRDARYAIQHFEYQTVVQNPFNASIRSSAQPKQELEAGIMTYRRASIISKTWHVVGLKFMRPYLIMRRRYGTTLPHILKKKRIIIRNVFFPFSHFICLPNRLPNCVQ